MENNHGLLDSLDVPADIVDVLPGISNLLKRIRRARAFSSNIPLERLGQVKVPVCTLLAAPVGSGDTVVLNLLPRLVASAVVEDVNAVGIVDAKGICSGLGNAVDKLVKTVAGNAVQETICVFIYDISCVGPNARSVNLPLLATKPVHATTWKFKQTFVR